MRPLKLTIEMIPRSAWGANLRAVLSKAAWDEVRRVTYARSYQHCKICQAAGRLEAHEVWEWKDHVQRLVGIEALCVLCHGVKHFGRSQKYGKGAAALEHFRRVNQLTAYEAKRAIDDAALVYAQRSLQKWRLDITWLAKQFPHLAEDVRQLQAQDTAIERPKGQNLEELFKQNTEE